MIMKHIVKQLKIILNENIRPRILLGLVSNERQLQADLYYCLTRHLSKNYVIWVEQVVNLPKYDLVIVKPDLIITRDSSVVAIIELKFLLYGQPDYWDDVTKLLKFENTVQDNIELFMSSMVLMKETPDVIEFNKYFLNSKSLYIFIVFGDKNCNAFKLNGIKKPKNFFHVCGYYSRNHDITYEFK